MQYLDIFTHITLSIALGFYLITNLQWYNYKIQRVILKHHKISWHLLYFVIPFVGYFTVPLDIFSLFVFVIYLPLLFLWNKKLDKKLVLTARVKRYFIILVFILLAIDGLSLASKSDSYPLFLPLALTYIITTLLEKIFFIVYKSRAKQRLKTIRDLKIIAITASYGKTSMKNYLYQVLNKKYNCYMTPRSVNTIGGIVKDINDDIPLDTQIYIAEAGAREKGDIQDIVDFLEPQYSIIGSVGEQHIEYFKTLDNIIYTKMEVLNSPRLEYGFVHTTVPILDYDTITSFPNDLKIISSTLDGLEFSIKIDDKIEIFKAPILGEFNAINLTAVVLMAEYLGMKIEDIKKALLNIKGVDHRLKITKAGGKTILDDSFNGNLNGMIEACKISSTFDGRKVIITPGVIEATNEDNIKLAKKIDEVFDIVILSGDLNYEVLKNNIKNKNIVRLKDKSKMEDILLKYAKSGDLILFANDAPNFI